MCIFTGWEMWYNICHQMEGFGRKAELQRGDGHEKIAGCCGYAE